MLWKLLVTVILILYFIKSVEVQQPNYFSQRKFALPYNRKLILPNLHHTKTKGYFIIPQKYPNTQSSYPSAANDLQESVMHKLASIAENDDLQCVPKLICEVTSDTITGRQQQEGFRLPININMESLLGLMAGILSGSTSPVLHFGKAALLGAAAKGNSRSCEDAYPDCPNDPDKLIDYLNNHNGGFFRYFNGVGVSPQPSPEADFYKAGNKKNFRAEKRIQNKEPVYQITSNHERGKTLTFPNVNDVLINDKKKSFAFPTDQESYRDVFGEKPYKVPKELVSSSAFTFEDNEINHLEFQKPLPNHRANPTIFPDRTGTGELRLDQSDIDEQYYQSVAAENDFKKSLQNFKTFAFPE